MEQLIQNPGRPSQGGEDSNKAANAKKGAGGNIFAKKVRKTNPATAPRIEYNDNNVSSGADNADESEEDGEDYEDDQSPEEREWNLKEEMTFEKICLTLLNEGNWNGLAIESKRHL